MLVKAPSKNLTCHHAPFERLKKIKKTVIKKNPNPILRDPCSAVSALFIHCISFIRGKQPKNKKSPPARSKPPEREGALAREK